ncbi:hypothetical protein P168DRAFT_69791 [Aspergillus campestris IBT 28561]|uniref:CorA-like transporter domain-containing protein n=1 Tax=Aspergillus campestris (strain IBT 28561) TaxID=1392248 RepID=A0A2I1CSH0_ASPC2|nr:uncharacterized protein P168DRAFT_69791 [Aspergillus campestris IBT 28561]PKY00575.1 hypothetical protein P168DRAFT_69791 [Aspergillus campestris IBT 28561]
MDEINMSYYQAVQPYLHRPALVSNPKKSNISLFDSTVPSKIQTFTDSEEFDKYISTTPKPTTRIISISSRISTQPLGITETSLRTLINAYTIHHSYLDRVLSFGDKPRCSDAGHGGLIVQRREHGSYDSHYLFAYPEGYNNGQSVAWTTRQTCVFHRFDPSGNENLWIFLHAGPRTKLQTTIEADISSGVFSSETSWCSFHLLALATYLWNWRWYIRYLGDGIERIVEMALTLNDADLQSVNQSSPLNLLKPQYLEDNLAPVKAQVGVALQIVRRLGELNAQLYSNGLIKESQLLAIDNVLEHHRVSLEGHLDSVTALERKVRGISQLLAVALNLRNQSVTIEINNRSLDMNRESVDDNATVRVVTLVTLTYLPASFVSTLLGMNLFNFNDPNGNTKFTISPQFWIFVVIAMPLTALTLGFWYFMMRRRLRKRKYSDCEGDIKCG